MIFPAALAVTPSRDSRTGGRARILAGVLVRWAQRARTRRELARLDARLRADIGVTHDAARREAAKPVWKA